MKELTPEQMEALLKDVYACATFKVLLDPTVISDFSDVIAIEDVDEVLVEHGLNPIEYHSS